MVNLAGHAMATEIVTEEFTRCGINVIPSPEPVGEPRSMVTGELNGFTFRRAWRYVCVDGLLPLAVAQKLYAHPVGVSDIRVDGDFGRPPPDGNHIEWFDESGERVFGPETKAECEVCAMEAFGEHARNWLASMKFADDLSKVAKPYITSYHIDSELGLYIFAEAVKEIADETSQLDAARASAIEVAERLRRLGRAEAAEAIKASIAVDAGIAKVAV